MRENHGLRNHAAGVAHQVFEQCELARTKRLDLAAAARRRAGEEIEREVADREPARRRRGARPPDQRVHARQQLGERERLHEIVVAADLESGDAIVDRLPRAEDQHRRADAALAQRADHADTVHRREHQIDNGDVVPAGPRHLQTGRSVARVIDDEARFPQAAGHEISDRLIVLDDECAHLPSERQYTWGRGVRFAAPDGGEAALRVRASPLRDHRRPSDRRPLSRPRRDLRPLHRRRRRDLAGVRAQRRRRIRPGALSRRRGGRGLLESALGCAARRRRSNPP